MIFSKNSVVFCSVFLIFLATAKQEIKANNDAQKEFDQNEFVIEPPKKLAAKAMGLISVGITLDPSFLVDGWVTKEKANTTVNFIKKLYKEINEIKTPNEQKKIFKNTQEETLFIQKHLKPIIDGIAGFVAPISEHKDMIVPIVEESLHVEANGVNKDGKVSLITKFFKSADLNAKAFFDAEVKDIHALIFTCKEIVIFFSDLTESLSVGARKVYDAAVNEKINQLVAAATAKKAAQAHQ